MSWEEVYESMKYVLDFFGVSWRDKAEVKIHLDGDHMFFTHNDRQVSIRINIPKEENDNGTT